jgi:hypothetical protein
MGNNPVSAVIEFFFTGSLPLLEVLTQSEHLQGLDCLFQALLIPRKISFFATGSKQQVNSVPTNRPNTTAPMLLSVEVSTVT